MKTKRKRAGIRRWILVVDHRSTVGSSISPFTLFVLSPSTYDIVDNRRLLRDALVHCFYFFIYAVVAVQT